MNPFHLQIVTPDGISFDGEAEKLLVRTITGDVCILRNHADYVGVLGSGIARVTINGEVKKAACNGGILNVTKDVTRVVATTFEWAENIDLERAKQAKAKAKERIENAQDAREIQLAEAKLHRAMTRINVVKD